MNSAKRTRTASGKHFFAMGMFAGAIFILLVFFGARQVLFTERVEPAHAEELLTWIPATPGWCSISERTPGWRCRGVGEWKEAEDAHCSDRAFAYQNQCEYFKYSWVSELYTRAHCEKELGRWTDDDEWWCGTWGHTWIPEKTIPGYCFGNVDLKTQNDCMWPKNGYWIPAADAYCDPYRDRTNKTDCETAGAWTDGVDAHCSDNSEKTFDACKAAAQAQMASGVSEGHYCVRRKDGKRNCSNMESTLIEDKIPSWAATQPQTRANRVSNSRSQQYWPTNAITPSDTSKGYCIGNKCIDNLHPRFSMLHEEASDDNKKLVTFQISGQTAQYMFIPTSGVRDGSPPPGLSRCECDVDRYANDCQYTPYPDHRGWRNQTSSDRSNNQNDCYDEHGEWQDFRYYRTVTKAPAYEIIPFESLGSTPIAKGTPRYTEAKDICFSLANPWDQVRKISSSIYEYKIAVQDRTFVQSNLSGGDRYRQPLVRCSIKVLSQLGKEEKAFGSEYAGVIYQTLNVIPLPGVRFFGAGSLLEKKITVYRHEHASIRLSWATDAAQAITLTGPQIGSEWVNNSAIEGSVMVSDLPYGTHTYTLSPINRKQNITGYNESVTVEVTDPPMAVNFGHIQRLKKWEGDSVTEGIEFWWEVVGIHKVRLECDTHWGFYCSDQNKNKGYELTYEDGGYHTGSVFYSVNPFQTHVAFRAWDRDNKNQYQPETNYGIGSDSRATILCNGKNTAIKILEGGVACCAALQIAGCANIWGALGCALLGSAVAVDAGYWKGSGSFVRQCDINPGYTADFMSPTLGVSFGSSGNTRVEIDGVPISGGSSGGESGGSTTGGSSGGGSSGSAGGTTGGTTGETTDVGLSPDLGNVNTSLTNPFDIGFTPSPYASGDSGSNGNTSGGLPINSSGGVGTGLYGPPAPLPPPPKIDPNLGINLGSYTLGGTKPSGAPDTGRLSAIPPPPKSSLSTGNLSVTNPGSINAGGPSPTARPSTPRQAPPKPKPPPEQNIPKYVPQQPVGASVEVHQIPSPAPQKPWWFFGY